MTTPADVSPQQLDNALYVAGYYLAVGLCVGLIWALSRYGNHRYGTNAPQSDSDGAQGAA